MTRPIVLSGFMGAGKSTVGARLARESSRRFVDLDAELVSAFGAPIEVVFTQDGEAAFRAMEARLLRQVVRGDVVVALGGGAVVDPVSRAFLAEHAHWVHLDVPLSVLMARVRQGGDSRPLWSDPFAVKTLFEARAPMYAEASFRVDASGTVGAVTAGIRALVGGPERVERPRAIPSREVRVNVPGAAYDVRIGRGLDGEIAAVGREVGEGPIALVTDWNVGPLHADRVARLLAASGRSIQRLVLPAGEARKHIGPVVEAVERLLDRGWRRKAPVVALGGGVLGDMAGLIASLTLRGVPFVQLPTTLLAMVDSSVGGKVGVDHRTGKNLIGAFHQPSRVVADLGFLNTLPPAEYRAGLAEVVKTAALCDPVLFARLESEADAVLEGDSDVLADVVAACVSAKASVVSEDPTERGGRRILNFGHTLGHALEAATSFGLRHGEAVAIGMVAACALAEEILGAPAEVTARIRELLIRLGLPVRGPAVDHHRLVRAMLEDKKRVGDHTAWIFLEKLGRPVIAQRANGEQTDMLRGLADRGILRMLE